MNKDVRSLSELFIEIGELIKSYEDNVRLGKVKQDVEQLYSIGEIIEIYPKLTKHILTKAINSGVLPVTWVGNERCFYLKDVDNYLANQTTRQNVTTWRTSEQS